MPSIFNKQEDFALEFMPIWGVWRFTWKHLIIEDLVLLKVALLLRSLISIPTSKGPCFAGRAQGK